MAQVTLICVRTEKLLLDAGYHSRAVWPLPSVQPGIQADVSFSRVWWNRLNGTRSSLAYRGRKRPKVTLVKRLGAYNSSPVPGLWPNKPGREIISESTEPTEPAPPVKGGRV